VIESRAVGVTPEYIGAMRAAAPRLANLDFNEFTGMRAVGVTPEFARALVAAGFPSITADGLMEARAVGLTGEYVSAMRSAGVQGGLDDFVQLRTVGVDPAFAARVRASGIKHLDADELVQLKALGMTRVPLPPRPPAPPQFHSRRGQPAASPRLQKIVDDAARAALERFKEVLPHMLAWASRVPTLRISSTNSGTNPTNA